MPSFDEARRIILERVSPLGAEEVPLQAAAGRALAEDFAAPWDFPAWDNSAMDGYALRAEDARAPVRLRLSAYIPAGSPGAGPLEPGTAAKILTGAPLPSGADAVVPIENAEERDGAVAFAGPVRAGANVRRRGEDLRAGERILLAGTALGPAEVSLLASCSRVSARVIRRARVAILSTGDELVPPGEPLGPGKIHDSNGLALAAAVSQAGAEPVLLGIARDDRGSLAALLGRGLEAEALITTAGVSMGDRDLVREVLQEMGVRQVFWGVDIKPGRPTAFALKGSTPVFSLPGNPVSTLLTFEEFVRPALLRMMGHRKVFRPTVSATFQDELRQKPGRVSFVRVRLERRGKELLAWSAGRQETGILKTMILADGIAVLPASQGDLRPGSEVEVQVLRGDLDMGEA
ncbi:MAG TPA: gephyrin-like molybdotransferase Glp [Anaeromyxobacteraceae bacterium]|nr:gephyrin-like molybdotransferase Glp [Anaeromyxobacteraceae bacterium]